MNNVNKRPRNASHGGAATPDARGARLTFGRRTFSRILASVAAVCAGCGRREEASPPDASAATPVETPAGAFPATRAGAYRFLALGDSYTIGEGVARAERWPVQLARALREAGTDVDEPHLIARTGWRTDELDATVTHARPPAPYDLVSLLVGVNDQYQNRPADEYRERFPALLGRAVALARGEPGRVIVLSIPDWGATPFGERNGGGDEVARAIDAFNAINRAESARAGVRYVDVTPVSRLAPKQPDLIAADGLHPSGKMYAEWVKLALPEARAALAQAKVAPGKPGG